MVPVSFTFSFCGEEFALSKSNALFWRGENALLVADLHLEKASYYAAHGQMLPPYDSRETLARLAQGVKETGARRIYTLGDNFQDRDGASRLEPHAAGMLDALTRAVDFVWITGNHDEGQSHQGRQLCGGTFVEELELAGMVLRHEARKGETRPELSGHFHPRLHMQVKQRSIRRPCTVVSRDNSGAGRMILPAFGALTGGMDASDPAILDAMQPAQSIEALVTAGTKLARFPLWRENTTQNGAMSAKALRA